MPGVPKDSAASKAEWEDRERHQDPEQRAGLQTRLDQLGLALGENPLQAGHLLAQPLNDEQQILTNWPILNQNLSKLLQR